MKYSPFVFCSEFIFEAHVVIDDVDALLYKLFIASELVGILNLFLTLAVDVHTRPFGDLLGSIKDTWDWRLIFDFVNRFEIIIIAV